VEPNSFNAPYDRVEEEDCHGEPFSPDLRIIHSQYRECKPVCDRIYEKARRDKEFVQSKQWDEHVERERKKKHLATVSIPMIGRHFNQQMGNALPGSINYRLTNTNPRPNDQENQSSIQAEIDVLNGHLRFIDKQSSAEVHRHKARKDQFAGGIGWLGVDYVHTDSLKDGEIRVSSPRYSNSIYFHPYYHEADASDMEYTFEFKEMAYEVAVAKFGDKIRRIKDKGENLITFDNYDDCRQQISTLEDRYFDYRYWMNDENKSVKIATHHWRRKGKRVFYVHDEVEYTAEQFQEFKSIQEQAGFEVEGEERIEKVGWFVEQRIICGWTVLDKKDFFIDVIPWTPVFGYTMENGTEYTYKGIIHDAVNVQEHINWLYSQAATKSSKRETLVLLENGVMADSFKDVRTVGGVKFLGINASADMSGIGQNPTIITSTEDGTKELAEIQFSYEILKDMVSTSSQTDQSQVINSAQQLALNISDRDSVREELDINWRTAMEIHTSKVIKMIKSVYDSDDLVKTVNLDGDVERIGSERITGSLNNNYSVDIKMSPSGTIQKQQAQQFSNNLIASPDPVRQTTGLIMSVDNSEMENKRSVMKMLYKQMFAAGQIGDIPQEFIEEILQEQQESGQLQQTLQQMAEPIAQQRVQEMLQENAIQAQIIASQAVAQRAQSDVERAGLGVQKAAIDMERAVRTDELQVLQEEEQTKQDFFELQKQIVQARQAGVEINAALLSNFINAATAVNPSQLQ